MRNNSRPSEPQSGASGGLAGEDLEVRASSGNIFADLGLPEAEDRLAKAEIANRIEDLIAERALTQAQAAALMGLGQPNVSDIVRGRLKGYTLDRLFQCLTALDQDVEVVIRPKRDAAGRARVVVSHG
jgi:predicted XRE-type DNA-binding protein